MQIEPDKLDIIIDFFMDWGYFGCKVFLVLVAALATFLFFNDGDGGSSHPPFGVAP